MRYFYQGHQNFENAKMFIVALNVVYYTLGGYRKKFKWVKFVDFIFFDKSRKSKSLLFIIIIQITL